MCVTTVTVFPKSRWQNMMYGYSSVQLHWAFRDGVTIVHECANIQIICEITGPRLWGNVNKKRFEWMPAKANICMCLGYTHSHTLSFEWGNPHPQSNFKSSQKLWMKVFFNWCLLFVYLQNFPPISPSCTLCWTALSSHSDKLLRDRKTNTQRLEVFH